MDQGNLPKKLERSLAQEFKDKKGKGELDMPPFDAENEICRVSLSHPFKGEKDRVAWISLSFTRKELLTNDVVVDDLAKRVIKKVELIFAEFDEGMKLVAPLVPALLPAPGTPNHQAQQQVQQPVQQAPAVVDGSAPKACEICGTALYWKPPGENFQTKAPYEGFWACPNYKSHPRAPVQ